MKVEAKVVADSISPDGVRLTTVECSFPRFILSELSKHRIFSMSAQSSRAVPVKKMIEMVDNDPFIPSYWGKNQRGMVAEESIPEEDVSDCEFSWLYAKDTCVESATNLSVFEVHKQTVSRILEPWAWQKAVITATEWDNFFKLRIHKDAQPEIRELAEAIYTALGNSKPKKLYNGEWHLPYVTHHRKMDGGWYETDGGEILESLLEAKKYSTARCATTSYRTEKLSVEKALEIYELLVESEPHHCYDDETEVLTSEGFKFWKDLTKTEKLASVTQDGDFNGFVKPSSWVDKEYVGEVYEINTKLISSVVTPNHRVLYKYRKNGSIKSENLVATVEELKGRPYYVPLSPNFRGTCEESEEYIQGKLHGFALGDGFVNKDTPGTLKFRLKKDRKISELEYMLKYLSKEYATVIREGVTEISVRGLLNARELLYDECGNKKMPQDYLTKSLDYQIGLFQGLCISDGTPKRTGFKFTSTSKSLADGFYNLSLVLGFGSCSMSFKKSENPKWKDNWIVTSRVSEFALVNDPRKPESHMTKREYSGRVYCATVDGGFLIVRRKGHRS